MEKNNRWIFILSHQQPSVKMGEYSVATNNRFALTIDEDEDLYELIEKQEEEKKRKEELAAEKAAQAKVAQSKGKSSKSAISNAKRILKTNDSNTQQTARTTNYNKNDGECTKLVSRMYACMYVCIVVWG